MKRLLVIILLLLPALPAGATGVGGVFGQGRTQFSVVGGNGYAFNKNYFILGASVSYYVLDGLGVGMSFEKWSGDNPSIVKYAPYVQYVFYQPSSIKPYIGAFYRRTLVEGQPDISSVGERAGIYISSGHNTYINIGFVQEVYRDCQEPIYQTCRATYSELGFTVGF